MQDKIKTIVKNWLIKEFNNPNALPGPMLDGLAEEIDKHSWEIYRDVQDRNDMEDIEYQAENMEIELTDTEKWKALQSYQNMEDSRLESLGYIIDSIVMDREKKSDDSEKREKA